MGVQHPVEDALVNIMDQREHILEALAHLFMSYQLYGFNHPDEFLNNVLTRVNRKNMAIAMDDPNCPDDVKAILKKFSDGAITDEAIDELKAKILGDVPAPSASTEKGFGTYL